MLSIQIICTGKLKEKFYIDAAAEYQKRLSSFCRLTVTELSEERLGSDPSPAQVEGALRREGEEILRRLPKAAAVIALCVEGQSLSSEALSRRMEAWAAQGYSQLVFVIGSSYGLHSAVKERAQLRHSMSAMTFPHHLARVMLLEQIYRGFKISEGSSYHK